MANPTETAAVAFDVPPERRPRHIAFIMDGNGRWAQRRGLPRIEGHRHGVASVRRTLEEANRLGIEHVTLYCLSSENWKRPQAELDFLMHLLEQYMIEQRSTLRDGNLRLRVIGRREGIPDDVLREMDKTVAMSRDNTGMQVCLAINYGARGEICDAVRHIAQKVRDGSLEPDAVSEELFAAHLYTTDVPDPDLVVRTAGEMRISNFLLWQMSYAEIWVTDVCWPDFDEDQLRRAIRDFAARDRRFGGLASDT